MGHQCSAIWVIWGGAHSVPIQSNSIDKTGRISELRSTGVEEIGASVRPGKDASLAVRSPNLDQRAPRHPPTPPSTTRLSLEQRRTVLWILNLLLQGCRTLVMHRQASMFVYQCGESAWGSLLLHLSDEQRLQVRKLIPAWSSVVRQAGRNALDQVQRDLPLRRKVW